MIYTTFRTPYCAIRQWNPEISLLLLTLCQDMKIIKMFLARKFNLLQIGTAEELTEG